MNRWLVSRVMIICITLDILAFFLAVYMPEHGGVTAFTSVGTASIVALQAKNIFDKNEERDRDMEGMTWWRKYDDEEV